MLRGVIALWASLFASAVHAQVSGSVAVVSDYRYRGVSLSDHQPALQLSIAYDHADGWYAGAFASSVQRAQGADGADGAAHLVSYLGYARRLRNGLSWEAGAEYAALVGASRYDYPEVYIGLASDHLSGRLYVARYSGAASPAVYAEFNGAHPLSEHTRLLGHLGWLYRSDSGGADPDPQRPLDPQRLRFDLRAGLGITLSGFDLQMAWVLTEGDSAGYSIFPTAPNAGRSGWVLGLSRAW